SLTRAVARISRSAAGRRPRNHSFMPAHTRAMATPWVWPASWKARWAARARPRATSGASPAQASWNARVSCIQARDRVAPLDRADEGLEGAQHRDGEAEAAAAGEDEAACGEAEGDHRHRAGRGLDRLEQVEDGEEVVDAAHAQGDDEPGGG